ncbi:hypothetical protein MMC34_007929 [Xylographa carneopallida]|nr:hypothetical protein [Xylographa carneopallida]
MKVISLSDGFPRAQNLQVAPHHESLKQLISANRPDLRRYELLRAYFHSHPELSQQESATAARVASHLRGLKSYTIFERIGGHGLAAVFENGRGQTVALRADMDALPVQEKTGLPFASQVTMRDYDGIVKPVMHACGHDIHITCLLAAAELMLKIRDAWRGTLILIFQPDEERGGGAQRMVDDGLYNRVPLPDIVLGQHVMSMRSGKLGSRPGIMLAASDSLKIKLYGRGGHASMPNRTIDPIVLASSTVLRLQTIVSREIDPSDMAVLSCTSIQAGGTENIISSEAELKVNIRTIHGETRSKILTAVRRIVEAECHASGAEQEPLIESTSSFPTTVNDEEATGTLQKMFVDYFGQDFDIDLPRVNGSEDFSALATSIGKPCSFWMIGGTDPATFDENKGTPEKIPSNHSPFFAPIMQPTIRIGTDAMTVAAMTFLRSVWT